MVISGNNLTTTNNTIISNEALQVYGFKNYIINGGFDVWQRGVDFNPSSNETYNADRWQMGFAGNACRVYRGGQVFTSGVNCIAIDGVSGNAVTVLKQKIESYNCRSFTIGNKFTLSFEIYANSGGANKTFDVYIMRPIAPDVWSTTYDATSIGSVTTTAGSKKVSMTFTIPSAYFVWGLQLYINGGSGLQSGQTVAFGNVQLEQGSVATPFEQRPIGLELSLCQRYYQSFYVRKFSCVLYTPNGDTRMNEFVLPVPMRVIPSVTPAYFNNDSINFGFGAEVVNAPNVRWNVGALTPYSFDFGQNGAYSGYPNTVTTVGAHCDTTFYFNSEL